MCLITSTIVLLCIMIKYLFTDKMSPDCSQVIQSPENTEKSGQSHTAIGKCSDSYINSH